jgi:hypothetical protein
VLVTDVNGNVATYRYDPDTAYYSVNVVVSDWIAIVPIDTTTGDSVRGGPSGWLGVSFSYRGLFPQMARITSFDLSTKPCSTRTQPDECYFGPCLMPETCGGQGFMGRVLLNAVNGALLETSVQTEKLIIPASNELYQPIDYADELNNTAWFAQLKALNGNNNTLISTWSSYGTEKLVLRPTHWTDSVIYQQLRFAELLGQVGLIPKGISERVNNSVLLDGYQYTGNYVNQATSFQTDVLLRPMVRVTLQDLIPEYSGEAAALFDTQQVGLSRCAFFPTVTD